MTTSRCLLHLSALALGILAALPGHAQSSQVFRCGNEYTNDAKVAASRGCKPIEGGNVSIIQGSSPPNPTSYSAGRPASPLRLDKLVPSSRVDSSVQRNRDLEARQVLNAELDKNRARLQELQAEYKDGAPDRLGSERNYQRYLDRTAQLKADIERTQSDIDGIQREISRLPAVN